MMKKILLFFIAFFISNSLFAINCSETDFAIFNIQKETFDTYVLQNELKREDILNSFYCWELPYVIENNILSESQYNEEIKSLLNPQNNSEDFSVNYFRSLGNQEDLRTFLLSINEKSSVNSSLNNLKQIQKQIRLRIQDDNIMYDNNVCSNISSVNSDLSKLPTLQKPFMIRESDLIILSFSQKELGKIIPSESESKLIIGKKEYDIMWNKNCITTINGNAIIDFITGSRLIISTFKTISKITTFSYKALIDLSYILIPIILMLWLFGRGIKPFNILNLFDKTESPDMQNIAKDLFDIILYMGIFYSIFSILNPIEIVNFCIEPILTLGIMVGDFVLSLTGISDLPSFELNISNKFMFENTALYFSNYMATIGIINSKIMLLGISMLPTWKFLAGILLIFAFFKITWEYLKTFWDIFLDLIMIVVFLPIWAMMWIFPETRSVAKKETLDKILDMAYKFAYLPFIILINYIIIKALLIKDLSVEELEKLNLNDQSVLNELADKMNFIDALFFGLCVSFIFTILKRRLISMLNVSTSQNLADKVKNIYQSNKKRYENIKDMVQKPREIKSMRERLKARDERMKRLASIRRNRP